MSRIRWRRGSAASWTAANPTLLLGEPGFETDTYKLKVGDGATAWNSLGYYATVGSSISETLIDAKGDLIVGAANDDPDRLPVSVTDGDVLTVDAGETLGVKWAAPTGGSGDVATDTIWNAKGDIAAATANDMASVVNAGAIDGYVLSTDSGEATGWAVTSIADLGHWEVVVAGTDSSTSLVVEVPSGTVNGVNAAFVLSATPDPAADLLLWKNGLLMKQGLDYTLSSATATFDAGQLPQTGDILLAAVPTPDGAPEPVTNEAGDDYLYAFTT